VTYLIKLKEKPQIVKNIDKFRKINNGVNSRLKFKKVESTFLFSEKTRQLSEKRIDEIATNLREGNLLVLLGLTSQEYYTHLITSSSIGSGSIVASKSTRGRVIYETLIQQISEHSKSRQLQLPDKCKNIVVPATFTQYVIEIIQALKIGKNTNDSLLKYSCKIVYSSEYFPAAHANKNPLIGSSTYTQIISHLADRHINEDAYQNLRTVFFL
jgi:hypothetical protein